jgi:hypothetical protein
MDDPLVVKIAHALGNLLGYDDDLGRSRLLENSMKTSR